MWCSIVLICTSYDALLCVIDYEVGCTVCKTYLVPKNLYELWCDMYYKIVKCNVNVKDVEVCNV